MSTFLASLTCHLRYALVIVCGVVMLILMSKWTGTTPSVIVKETQSCQTAAEKLVKEAREYANAPRGANGPLGEQVSELLHASTALAYMQAAQLVKPEVVSQKDQDLQKALTQRQQAAVQALVTPVMPPLPPQMAANGPDPNFFSPLYR